MNICVVGLGKIGLPLAVQYASKGHRVFGADIDESVVEKVNLGLEPFPGEFDLQRRLKRVVSGGLLTATADTTAAVEVSEVIVVVVPLFVDTEGHPDFKWMDNATISVGLGLQQGALVSYETTLPVGTTRGRFAPLLQEHSGLTIGEDFHLIFSPERVLTGRVFSDLRRYPKLVGGVSRASEDRGILFYEEVLDFDERSDLKYANGVWGMGSAEAAEMAKLAETTYRDVNIGLANQFARFAQSAEIDIYKVIEACNSQPYSQIHLPGIAVGGHCIPVYPRLYLHNDPDASVVSAAREMNQGMPKYAVNLLEDHLGSLSDLRVAVFGISYRGGVKESAFSGVFDVVKYLDLLGARVSAYDPMYSEDEIRNYGWDPFKMGSEVDALIIQADHEEFRDLNQDLFPGLRAVVDGRNIISPSSFEGISVLKIGAP